LEIARLSERLRAQLELIDPDAGLSDVTVDLLERVTSSAASGRPGA